MSSALHTLLPPNATDQERALEAALYPATDLPVAINTLWNPTTCPEPLLPWLAWTLSVDEWEPDWTVAIKRAVIAESMAVHLVKGTVASVRRVLAAVGVPAARLTEWWQTPADALIALVHSADPYTYTVGLDAVASTQLMLDSHPALLTPALYDSLFRLLGHTQPARCDMCVYVETRISSPLNLGGASRLMQYGRFIGVDDPGIAAGQSLNLGGASRLLQFARFDSRPLLPWALTLDYRDNADPVAWVLTLHYSDNAAPVAWVLTLDYTDAADLTGWALILDYTDNADPVLWVLTLDYTDNADPAAWALTLDYSDNADPVAWLLTLDYTDNANLTGWVLMLDYTDAADVAVWVLTLDYIDQAEI